MTVRTRFSPSPTGMIHLGNLRAALFSYLYAIKEQGVFILRIEDTDALRSEEKYTALLQQDLKWLGVIWQEGPGVDGQYGPYWQSQRQDLYATFYKELEAKQFVYPCFCTDQQLQLSRKLQLSRGIAPRYAGTCKSLAAEEIQRRIAAGETPAWRFAVPKNKTISFEDLVKGPQRFESNDIGDFIVRRQDGTAPFLFCNAVDDALMKVTHVLRGEDHVANTPRQIMILDSLNLSHPQYGHLSMIVGDDGAPLSKRHGSFSLEELYSQGYLPKAIINYMSRLGHAIDSQSLLDVQQIAAHFHLQKVSRSPTRFDRAQLVFWQKLAVQQLNTEEIWRWLGEAIQNQVPLAQQTAFIETIRDNIEFPHDAAAWISVFFHDQIDIPAPDAHWLTEAGEQFFVEAENAVNKHGMDLEKILTEMKQTLGVSGKKLFMPLRIALSGKTDGPQLAAMLHLLGQKKVLHRLSHAFKMASRGGE